MKLYICLLDGIGGSDNYNQYLVVASDPDEALKTVVGQFDSSDGEDVIDPTRWTVEEKMSLTPGEILYLGNGNGWKY